MKRILLVLFLLILIFFNKGFGQDVTVDFSGKADTTVTINTERNSPNCNGATSDCVIFTVKLNPNADLLNFQIFNPAPNGAAAFYTINCDGIQRSLGTPICITGSGTVTITYCKVGKDPNANYVFTSSTAVKASADLNLRQLCTGAMSVTGLLPATVTWTSISPGVPGQYDSYLSSPTGSLSTNITPDLNAPTTILYKVSGNTNCAANRSDTVQVTTYPPLAVVLTPNPAVICATGGSIVLTATPTGGNAPYTYLWSNGATTQSITVSTAATYTVDVSDNTTGCGPITESVTVTAAPTPAAPTASGAIICAGSTATVNVTSPVPGETYRWYDAASGGTLLFTGASYTTPVLSTTTIYYVEVTSAAGCTSSRTAVTVTVNTIPITPTAPPASTCNGSSATLSASSPSVGTYTWYDSASGGNLVGTGATFTTPALTVNTTYYVQITSADGCTSPRAAVNVTVNPTPVAPTANSVDICNNTAANLSATVVPGGIYEWYDAPAGGTLLISGSNYTTPALTSTTIYYVQVTVNGCTSARRAVTVTVAPIPTAPTASGATICSGSTTTLTANAPAGTYAWYDSASGGNLLSSSASFTTPVLSANIIYYVQAIVNGCVSARVAVTVTVNPLPVAPTVSGTTTVCEGDGTVLTATAVPGITHRWYSTATGGTQLFTGDAYTTPILPNTTTYYVDATSASGCTGPRRAVTVTVIPRVNPAFTYPSGTFCQTGNDPTPLTFVGPAGGTFTSIPNTLVINPTTGEIDLDASPLGTYTITFTTNTSCSYSSSANITITTAPDARFSYGGPYCQFQSNPLPTFPTGASAGVFTSTAGLVFLNASTGEINLQLSLPGTYPVTNTIAASGGCAATSATNTVTINPTPVINSAASLIICNNTSPNYAITLQNNISGVTFSWSRAGVAGINNGSSISGNTTTIAETLINTTDAPIDVVYTIIPTANGCNGTPFTFTVIVSPTPTITSAASQVICNNTTLNYPIQSNASGATFTWSRPSITGINNGSGLNGSTSIITETLNNTTNAPINVIYTIVPSINGCDGAAFNYTVTVNPTLTMISNATGVVCSNAAQNYSIQSNVNSATFTWSRAFVAGISNIAVNGQTSSTITETLINTTNSPISVVYTIIPSINGCDGAMFTYTVTVNPTAAITNTSLVQTVCSQSNSVAVVFTTTDLAATVQWTATASSNISGFLAIGTGDLLAQTLVNTGNTAGTIDYLVTPYLNGCPGTPVHYTITVNPKPATPVLSSNSPVCQNYALTLTTPTIPGATYLWTGPNGFTSAQQNPTINNVQLAAAGQYSLVITVNGCSSDAGTVNVTVLPTPTAPMASSNGPLCAGNTLMLAANTIAGATYSWTGPNGFTSSLQNPSLTNITTSGGGVYAVTATVNGCTSAAGTVTVVVNAIPAAPLVTTNGPVCEGSTISLSVNNIPGTTYSWTGPNGFTSNLPNPTIPAASQVNAGVYTVTATVGGCTGPPASVTVVVNQTPINPVASSNGPICTGNPIILSATTFAGAVYQWTGPNGFSSNLQNPVIDNATLANEGVYTVSITAPGCSVTVSTFTTVDVNPTPVAPTVSSNSPVCLGDNLNLTASNVAGAIYSWTGPNGFTSALQNPIINNTSAANAGIYSVTVTVDGCTSAAATTNVVISVPKIAIIAGNNREVCANNPNVIVAGTVTNDNTGLWTSSGTGSFSPSNTSLSATYIPSVADITAGNVMLTLSSVNNGGCGTSSSSIQVTITPTPIVSAGGNNSICDNDAFASLTGSITYATGGRWTTTGTGTFSPSANAINANYIPSETDKAIGSVRLTLTSVGNNCIAVSDEMTLTIVRSPTISMPDTKYVLQDQTVVLNPTVTGSNLQYSWSPATNLSSATVLNPTVTGVTSQLYTLSVTGAGGCIVQKQVMVTVLKPIVVPNTFTPNGDGINDKWVIKELENYPGAQLSLFNRYGTILYQTKGNYVPWDGNYNGQPVPFGTYYYLIELGKYGSRMSGYIMVLR